MAFGYVRVYCRWTNRMIDKLIEDRITDKKTQTDRHLTEKQNS